MIFYQGEFKLTQRRDRVVISALRGGSFSGCPTPRANGRRARSSAAHGKRPVRKLWAEGHGSVLTDRVAVTNLVTHKHITVRAGHSYLANAPGRRGH